ncbi:dihydrodipicolinate synthase family protein [Nonomuraea phyllanthi]|uniref:Dihydrodipicolinate synthase family protein n=1 Tax=Nonomuraea phyllanthi TaxID=2219224 RepID=A0A5C4WVJ5_9ACTN|nr:dihydrodipicolinate synthase family protein [Nonomuraea phyllanthi]KAB8197608.1 dihydrodipicolinate synthase family protein [Nonomuraea phyllanthi]QFY06396.1 dihydrodipicolinate synthase family protein [Nonomuraea phyllanthi]
MKPLTAPDVRGVWGTTLLPLAGDGAIDWERQGAQIDALAASGVDGVYAHGTAGEFHALEEDEFDKVNTLLAERCEAAGLPFQIGGSHPATPVMLSRVRRAAALEPGAIQVILPDWVPLNDDEVIRFLVGAAEAAGGVPLVLYNPPHAKTQVPPRVLARATREVPQLIGVKMAGGDHLWYAEMTAAVPSLSIFIPGHLLATGLARGAHGSYSNIAAMSPRGAVAWFRLMTTNPAAALDVERRIGEFFQLHIAPLQAAGLSNPALDKFLAMVGGWADIGTTLRWPASSAPADAVAPARADAHRLLPELFPA